MIDIETAKAHVEDFLNMTSEARMLSERDRDYYNNRQWSEAEIAKLNGRGQAAIIDNRIKPKVEGLKGLLIQRRTDPKGWPRTKKHEQAGEAVSDALRYVADNTRFDDIELETFENLIIEGYAGVFIDIKKTKRGIEINPIPIPWDRIYFDPYSRRARDFKDAMRMGIITWMDVDVAKQVFKGKSQEIDEAVQINELSDETFEDRPKWVEQGDGRDRIRVAQEFYLHGGKWYMCVITGDNFLVKPRLSTYLDEDGEPTNPIELVGAYIDRLNYRYGEARYWIDPQDEINHRRSKFLFSMSARQTFGIKGAVEDVARWKRELAKPDGHAEFPGNEWGKDFGIIPTMDMSDAQFKLLQESKQSLDATSFDAKTEGPGKQDLSGRAVQALQSADLLQTGSLFSAMEGWKQRVFTQVWWRIKQHWDAERWVRVTDDYNKLRFVGFNIPMTRQQMMEDFIKDEANPMQERQAAAQQLQMVAQQFPEKLQEVIEVKNPVAELDMDIIIDQSANSINAQQEQFRMLVELAAARPEIPTEWIIRLSELRDKEDLIKEIKAAREAALQAQNQLAQLESQEKVVSIQGKQIQNQKTATEIDGVVAKTTVDNMAAITKNIENQILVNAPDPTPQVNT